MDHIHILKYEFINSNSIESELFYIWNENKFSMYYFKMCERADKKQFKNENRSISSGAGYLQILETTVTLNLKIKNLHMHEYLISDKKKK